MTNLHYRFVVTEEIDSAGHTYTCRSSNQYECPECQALRRQEKNCENQRRYYALRMAERSAAVKQLDVVEEWHEALHNKCAPGSCKFYTQCEEDVMTGAAIPCIPFAITPRPRADGLRDRSIVGQARVLMEAV